MGRRKRQTITTLTAAALAAALAIPAGAQVGKVELDIAGYLCGF